MRLWLLDVGSLCAWKYFGNGDVESLRDWWADLVKVYDPQLAVACLDCDRASNWRKSIEPSYKMSRDVKPKDEGLADAMRTQPGMWRSLGVTSLRFDTFEADDIIATLSTVHDGEAVIVSTDSDLHQLVDERVQVYDPRPDKNGTCKFYDVKAVTEKHFVPPNRLRELKAIAGDTSDNIVGVKGLGKVFAATVIQQTKSRMELERRALDGSLSDISDKQKKIFAEGLDDFRKAYELVGLRFDVPIPEGLSFSLTR